MAQKPKTLFQFKVKNPEGSQYKYTTVETVEYWERKDGGKFLSVNNFKAKENLARIGITTLDQYLEARKYQYNGQEYAEIITDLYKRLNATDPVKREEEPTNTAKLESDLIDINDLPF